MKCYISLDTTAVSVGADKTYEELSRLQNKYHFEVLALSTRGLFWLEPLLEIKINGKTLDFRNVKENNVESIIQSVLEGHDHPLFIGNVDDLAYLKNQRRIIFKNLGLIEPTNFDDYIRNNGLKALENVLRLKSNEVIERIKDAGIEGRGGAYFPAYTKWQTVLNINSDKKYIICNADEGDSGSFADRLILENDPYSLIEGIVIAGVTLKIQKSYIYLRSEYKKAKKILGKAIETAYSKGLLGKVLDSNYHFDLDLVVGGGSYVCGEESALIESLENKRGLVRQKPPVPAVSGLLGKPTLVNNVLTFVDIVRLFNNTRDTHTIPIQLSGAIKQTGLVEVTDEKLISEIIYDFGSGSYSQHDIKALQIGGPLGAFMPKEKFDLSLNRKKLAMEGFVLGHGSIVGFDEQVNIRNIVLNLVDFFINESCGKCSPCRIGQVRLKEILEDYPIKHLELVEDLLSVMTNTSLCGLGSMTYLPIKSALKFFKEDFGLQGD